MRNRWENKEARICKILWCEEFLNKRKHFMSGFRVKRKLKNNREIYFEKLKKINLGKKKVII